jgi:hypothetical protein
MWFLLWRVYKSLFLDFIWSQTAVCLSVYVTNIFRGLFHFFIQAATTVAFHKGNHDVHPSQVTGHDHSVIFYLHYLNYLMPVPVAARPSQGSLACWDCGFESHRGRGCLSVVIVVCCQVEVSVASWSLIQRSPTDCCIVWDLETSRIGAPYIYMTLVA